MTNGDPEGRIFLSYPHILGDAAKYLKKTDVISFSDAIFNDNPGQFEHPSC